MAAVTGIAYAVARRWVPEPAARRSGTATGEAATMVVERGTATLDMRAEPAEDMRAEPDELVSLMVHGTPDASDGPRGAYPTRLGSPSPVDGSGPWIEVRHGPDRSTARMGIDG
ncbi:hypothetical protein ACVGVM_11455 [Pseudonocardia bannensis]|uniref:Uncharacterized protein n=1 Tax=Pseudonocardia bannensis TaxID=630973 RepID=A0A848DIG7_9PSEU|nr:hypothetical protein [Pseudonocardia bannensis]NMH92488.1 hypothetical protein [Pseudonocardia bannensis]